MSILPGIYNEKSPLSLEEIDSGALRSIYGNPTLSSKALSSSWTFALKLSLY
jgi:hypothetical protein